MTSPRRRRIKRQQLWLKQVCRRNKGFLQIAFTPEERRLAEELAWAARTALGIPLKYLVPSKEERR